MCVTTQHHSSIFFFTMFCKKKHFHVNWTKVRCYYLGSSWLHLLILIVSFVDILVNDMKSLWADFLWLSQSEHGGFKQHLWVKLKSCWQCDSETAFQWPSVTFSVQTCSEITAWMALCKNKELCSSSVTYSTAARTALVSASSSATNTETGNVPLLSSCWLKAFSLL